MSGDCQNGSVQVERCIGDVLKAAANTGLGGAAASNISDVIQSVFNKIDSDCNKCKS